jgi:hypothetical protein
MTTFPRSYIIDIVAVLAMAALGLSGKLSGHEALGAILLVVVGRLRPPHESGGGGGRSGGDGPGMGGIATILLAIYTPAEHAIRHLTAGRHHA